MKLTSTHVERTLSQYPARAIPDDHPMMPRFNSQFGNHTFFIDESGLIILEPAEAGDDGKMTGRVIKLAGWSDDRHTTLMLHDREVTDILVVLDKAA
ncbi:hypothetical protein GCM10007874_51630 [Labrys miyagiensis]|uniref:Uncharacterized protein n=1 Tax=Labrys miyagiensis TaxID=346912 RepID=A0ABQ6CV55_9HYPH|nr:hypothetical protein [Labrys miyagiensis]GLS22146.1 hypothetical protein GCM10007874_51630 [Labrys miyagiensis]